MEYKYDTRDVLIDLYMNDDQASVNGFEHIHELVLYIEELQSRIAELEKDAARWKAATRDLDINDVAVVVYDKYGDERVVTGDDADSAIDTAMQKD